MSIWAKVSGISARAIARHCRADEMAVRRLAKAAGLPARGLNPYEAKLLLYVLRARQGMRAETSTRTSKVKTAAL